MHPSKQPEYDMSTHGALTESSLSDHWVTHDRKGREGKGVGREDGPKAPSMTSGRGWTGSALGTAHVVSASVMDGHYVASDGGVR